MSIRKTYDNVVEDFYVNERQFFALSSKGVLDYIISDDFTGRTIAVNEKINELFESSPFLQRLLFDYGYNSFLNDEVTDCLFTLHFDHSQVVRVKENIPELDTITITGILNFPYLNWEQVGQWIDKTTDEWEVYIMNPHLMSYYFGVVGLFLTPNYYDGEAIKKFNNYIMTLTGYPLFLKYTQDENVEEIKVNEDLLNNLNKNNFIDELSSKCEDDVALIKLLHFWRDNDCVQCSDMDDCYKYYLKAQPYSFFTIFNFKKIISTIPFRVINKQNNDILGTFMTFQLDASFNVIDSDNGEVNLNDTQLKDLLDGKYDFELIDV